MYCYLQYLTTILNRLNRFVFRLLVGLSMKFVIFKSKRMLWPKWHSLLSRLFWINIRLLKKKSMFYQVWICSSMFVIISLCVFAHIGSVISYNKTNVPVDWSCTTALRLIIYPLWVIMWHSSCFRSEAGAAGLQLDDTEYPFPRGDCEPLQSMLRTCEKKRRYFRQ